MKSVFVIVSTLLVPGLSVRAATEQEKVFIEKYKTALETKDTATLQSCLYATSADPMIVGFYRMMPSNGVGDKVSKIDLVDLTPDEVKKGNHAAGWSWRKGLPQSRTDEETRDRA